MSRAILLDEADIERLSDDQVDLAPIEEEEEETQEPLLETVAEENSFEDDLPEKYRNKSIKDLVRMHQDAEKLIGRQGGEVGELRGIVDQYIQTQLATQAPQKQPQEEDDVDFFVDPDRAVQKAIENHPSIKQAQMYTEEARKAASLSVLKNKHPDMAEILQDNSFGEWVKASKIRTQLFLLADQKYDADAADELFSLWKDRKQTVQNTATVEKAARKEALKAANTGNAQGSAEGRSRKKFRRADIIKLMQSDPDRYEALQPEIMQAYAEGRVI